MAIQVRSSSELTRIRELPRHNGYLSNELCRLYKEGGKMQLRDSQKEALSHALLMGGGAIRMKVGSGKTLVACLIPSLFSGTRAIILTSASLRDQGERMMHEYSRHFHINKQIMWISYETLSSPNYATLLDQLQPDIIIADESQTLGNVTSTRTKRFLSYMRSRPETKFFFMSGTFTKRSIKDFAHLMELALHERSPLPRTWNIVTEWADCLDCSFGDAIHPGDLMTLAMPDDPKEPTIPNARQIVHRRIKESYGVMWSHEVGVEADLKLRWFADTTDSKIQDKLQQLHKDWIDPDGEELVSPLDVSRVADQIKLGGYYRWVYPPHQDWLNARRDWNKVVSVVLKSRLSEEDSPALVRDAVLEGKFPEHRPVLMRWIEAQEKYPEPPTEWVWVSDVVVKTVADYVAKEKPMIVWCDTVAFAEELAKRTRCVYYGAGTGDEINKETGKRSIIASLNACKTGKNLQAFSRNLVMCGPQMAGDWEQMIGRTHRSGQEAECVVVEICGLFKENFRKAVINAKYLRDMEGDEPRILYGTKEGKGWDSGWMV